MGNLKYKKGKKKSPNFSPRQAVNRAIELYKQGMSKVTCSNTSGVCRSKLDRYLEHYDIQIGDQERVNYGLLPVGRTNFVDTIVEVMMQSVSTANKSVKGKFTARVYEKKAKTLMTEAQTNAFQTLPKVSHKSFGRAYRKSCGDKKLRVSSSYADRAVALCDYRNALSCCVTWFVCLNVEKVCC